MRRFVRRPSPAMIVALIALVAATAGNAIADQVNAAVSALKANSVTSKSVKNGSLLVKDFKKSELKKLTGKTGKTGATGPAGAAGAAGAAGPQGPAGTPDGYTKTEADAAFLGKTAKSADADKLDGVDGSSFVTGGGSQNFGSTLMSGGAADVTLLTIPNIGKVKVGCATGAPEAMDITLENDQSSDIRFTSAQSSSTGTALLGRQLASGATFNYNLGTTNQQIVFQFTKTTGVSLFTTTNTASVLLTAFTNPTGDPDKCRYQAQVQTGSSGFSFVIFNPVLLP